MFCGCRRMNAGLMTIDYMLPGSTSTPLEPAKQQPFQRTKQVSRTSFEQAVNAEIPKKRSDDNKTDIQSVNTDKPFQEMGNEGVKEKIRKNQGTSVPQDKKIGDNYTSLVSLQIKALGQKSVRQLNSNKPEQTGLEKILGEKAVRKSNKLLTGIKVKMVSPAKDIVKPSGVQTISAVNKKATDSNNLQSNFSQQNMVIAEKTADVKSGESVDLLNSVTSAKENKTRLKNTVLPILGGNGEDKKVNINTTEENSVKMGGSNKQAIPKIYLNLVTQSSNLKQDKKTLNFDKLSDIDSKRTFKKTAFFKKNNIDINGISEITEKNNKKQDLLNNSNAQKVNISELVISGEQKKNNTLTSDGLLNSIHERVINSNKAVNISGSQKNAEIGDISNKTFSRDMVDGVSRQISESIQNSLQAGAAKQQIRIQLNPPELGKVCIKFQEQQNSLTGVLEVEKAQTRNEIEHALPQIIRNLGELGIQLKRLDVTLTDDTQQFIKDQSLQNDSFHPNDFVGDDGHNRGDSSGDNEPLTSDTGYGGGSPEIKMQLADDSIDMFV